MAAVHRLARTDEMTLGHAIDAYLATLRGMEQANTRRAYGQVLRRLAAEFGRETAPDSIAAERFAAWFGQQWGERTPSTWNVSLDAARSAAAYWIRNGWLAADPRKSGPVFVTERKACVQLPAADLDEHGHARLSHQQAAALFSEASGGATLHQLRHSALTHDAEDGTGTPMLMARSGHTSV